MTEYKERIIDFFNCKAEIWDDICVHDQDKLSLITSLCGIKPGDKVLDAACGTGIMSNELIKSSAGKITGLDISDKMIETAKKKFNSTRLEFVVDDLYSCSIQDYDVALLYCVYPHLMDRPALVEKLHSILRPGGRFLIAHSESAASINSMHDRRAPGISLALRSADVEACLFKTRFKIDTLIDTDELYIISGTSLD